MKLLSSDSFERARTFAMEHGREKERRLLSYGCRVHLYAVFQSVGPHFRGTDGSSGCNPSRRKRRRFRQVMPNDPGTPTPPGAPTAWTHRVVLADGKPEIWRNWGNRKGASHGS